MNIAHIEDEYYFKVHNFLNYRTRHFILLRLMFLLMLLFAFMASPFSFAEKEK